LECDYRFRCIPTEEKRDFFVKLPEVEEKKRYREALEKIIELQGRYFWDDIGFYATEIAKEALNNEL